MNDSNWEHHDLDIENPTCGESEEEQLQLLVKIGLSKTAAHCYLYLANYLPRGVRTTYIVQELPLPKSSIYRALKELATKGFVRHSRIVQSATWRAEPLTHALDNYAEYQRQLVRPLIRLQRDHEDYI